MAGSGNPFLDAINSIPMPNINVNVPDFSSMYNPHGVDLSNVDTSSPSGFHFTAAGFSPTASTPALPTSLQTASQQYSHPMGNFGADIQNVWSHLSGALQGAQLGAGNALRNTKLGNNNRLMMETGGRIPQQKPLSKAQEGGYTNVFSGLLKGVKNPTATHARFKQGEQQFTPLAGASPGVNAFLKGLRNFGLDTVTDPLTYVPFGKAASVASKTLHLGELSKPVLNALQHIPGSQHIANAYQHVFSPIAGARSYFLHGVGQMSGKTESGANAIKNQVVNIFKGTTPEQRIALTHALESTAPGTTLSDPALESLRQQVEPLLEQARQNALDRGLISGELNPEEYGVGRYIPHISTSKLDEEFQPFKDISQRSPNIDAGKSRGLAGTIQALNSGDNKLFEEDMAKILGYHLNQINKASNLRDLIGTAMKNGIETGGDLKAGDIFPGTVQKAVEYSHDGNTVLLPESEARYLTNLTAPKADASRFLSGLYRKSVNGLNRMMFLSSPFIHIVNNLGTQSLLHDPGILKDMPQYLKEAVTGVKPGSKMDQALQAGALHLTSEIGHTTNASNLANDIAKVLDGKQGGFRSALRAYNNLTPNVEKAYRAAAYHRALQRGMSSEDAVKWVRSIFGGNAAHDAASNFEKTARAIMPFYNWTKTAIGSNVKNFLHHPAPYVAGYHALDNYNQAVTGHPMSQNHNPLSVGLPWKDKNGNQEYWTLYAPPFDVAKLGKDIGKNGVRGPLDFAFTRSNPLVRFGFQLGTGEQNPFASPLNKFNVDKYPELAQFGPQYNEAGMAFGGKGPKLPAYLAQLLQDTSNPVGTLSELQGQSPRDWLLSQIFGGAVSAPNPQSAINEQNYNNREISSQFKSYLKNLVKQGQ